ncbi:uncharacterized protein PG998_011261 [Apiospora kogelbergensis]|uniref:Uncharacterized protein n=1 Tax=Apiospora kogelbergensis TaxID=1337665 RepID=A0AAW0RC34_9PEZI
MKSLVQILLGLALASGVLTHAMEAPISKPQLVTLVFHSADGQYNLRLPADGREHLTNNAKAVNYIDAPDFTAQKQCVFRTPGKVALVNGIDRRGLQQILLGPPQPVIGVTCSGTCVPTWVTCVSTSTGVERGECCSGYCDKGRCQPWLSPAAMVGDRRSRLA